VRDRRRRVLSVGAAAVLAVGAAIGGYLVAPESNGPATCTPDQGGTCLVDEFADHQAEQPLLAPLTVPTTKTASGNGFLPTSALSPITGGHPSSAYPGTGQMANAAAAAWNAAAVRIHDATGRWINTNGPDSAYRPYARQVYWRNYWCGRGACQNAAVPGTSNHGLGTADDVDATTGAELAQYGSPYGFRRSCSDAPWESWHWHWCGGWSGHDPGPYGHSAGPTHHRPPPLHVGSQGKRVKALQVKLHNLHGDRPRSYLKHRPVRYFGHGCKDAVHKYQKDHHSSADGVVGPRTAHSLRVSWKRWRHNH
jgi:hypothetical protein